MKLILGDHVPLTISSIKSVDPTLGNSLSTLQQFAQLKRAIEADDTLKKGERNKRIANLEVSGVKLEDMCLDFTVPGYDDLELKVSLFLLVVGYLLIIYAAKWKGYHRHC